MMQKRETFVRIMAVAMASAVLLSVFAFSNTILYQQYFYDQIVFKTISDGWSLGLIPYKDLFDHKGPVVYVIQMMASVILISKVGIWGMELIWIVATCELLFRCGRYLGASKILCYFSVMIALLNYACYVDGGNTVEVWSLPFEVLPLLMLLRHFSGRTKLIKAAFVSGVCFGIVTMIRVNNNAMITGLVIGMVIYLCHRREYRQILLCAGWLLAGVSITVIPFVIYFLCKGVLEDFIYCVFTFNMRYMEYRELSMMEALDYAFKPMSPCLIFILISAFYSIKRGARLLTVLSPAALIVFLTFSFGRNYLHYYLMALPFSALGIQMLAPFNRYLKVLIIGLYLLYYSNFLRGRIPSRICNINAIRANEAIMPGVKGQRFISEYFPDEDKSSIYLYGSMEQAAALDENGYLPVGKYFFLQEALQNIDTRVHDEIIDKFREANPKWVIAVSETVSPLEECLSGYVEIPRDSLPESCPGSWHIYSRK